MNKKDRSFDVVPGAKFRHFKGRIYEIVCVAMHTETGEELVIYKHDNFTYARPVDMFLSEVDKEKYPDMEQKYRFEVI